MKIEFWYIGKTNEKYLTEGIGIYAKRLKHYCKYEEVCIPDVKPGNNTEETKNRESDVILSKLKNEDFFVLLDEQGKTYDSVKYAKQLQKWMNAGPRRMVFLVAGAFGAADSLKDRSNARLSLSEMTFSHQMIRLFFVEQLYRAFTILRNEKYHNL